MNLSDIRTALQDLYGNTLSSEDDFYTRIVNRAYQKLCSHTSWWWLEGHTIITADQVLTAYTGAAATQGDTKFTKSGVSSVFGEHTWMWVSSPVTRLYRITSISGNDLNIDSNVVDDETDYTINLWGDTYSLPADCESVLQVTSRDDPNILPLREVDIGEIDRYGPDVTDLARQFADRYAVVVDHSSSATAHGLLIRLFPPQDEVQEYQVIYRKDPADLSADADIPMVPQRHHPLLVDMAKLELLKNEGEDSDRIGAYEVEVAKGMASIMREQRLRGQKLRRFGRSGLSAQRVIPFTLKNTEGNAW
jgi:hypothetical protein